MKNLSKKQLLNLEVQNTPASSKEKTESPVLGIDYGEKFSGISWTPDGHIVFPLLVCDTKELIKTIQKKSQEKNTNHLILGLPISSDNSENHICRDIRSLGSTLNGMGFRVEYINERYSSQNTLSPDKKRIDDLAAAQILEFWIAQKNS